MVPGHVRWRCRRGMLEVDLLLAAFLDGPEGYAGLDAAGRDSFAALLEESDQDLLAWVLEQAPVPQTDWQDVVARIRRAAHA